MLVENLEGNGHLRSSHPINLKINPITSSALPIILEMVPRAPPKVELKDSRIGLIAEIRSFVNLLKRAPTNCSAAQRGALTMLPTRAPRKSEIVWRRPAIKF